MPLSSPTTCNSKLYFLNFSAVPPPRAWLLALLGQCWDGRAHDKCVTRARLLSAPLPRAAAVMMRALRQRRHVWCAPRGEEESVVADTVSPSHLVPPTIHIIQQVSLKGERWHF